MPINNNQLTAIATQLAVDLSAVTTDRLIELCLLHRSAPQALLSFVAALDAEISRRFTAEEIAANDVMFSVLQNFANNFASPVPYFQMQMIQMAATVNRDIWFQNNTDLFSTSIDDIDVMTWLVTQPDILQKCLNNSFGLTMIAQSTTASTVILTNDPAVTLWKQATGLWSIWPSHSAGMNVLALSSELMSYVAASSTAMTAVIASSTAMTAVIASSTAMTAVAASSTALSKIVVSTSARNALILSNSILQSVRQKIYNTVSANWTKNKFFIHNENSPTANAAMANPVAFVFASMSRYDLSGTYTNILNHQNGTLAYAATRSNGNTPPSGLIVLDAVSFNGAVFNGTSNGCYSYIELWTPPAT